MAKTRIKPGFLNLPPGSRVRENRGKSEGLSTLGSSSESRIKPGFFLYLTLSLSQALGQRLLCCPKRGTFVPPFFVYGKAGRWCPVGTVQRLTEPAGETCAPCNPFKAVELCSTPRKFFEKNLTKNFSLSPPNPSAGI